MHSILQAILAGDPQRGRELHAALAHHDGADDRWCAYCLFLQGQLLPAKDLLLRAKAKGAVAAAVELATVLRHLGAPRDAWRELHGLPRAALTPFDRALAAREAGALYLYGGRPALALREFEHAWRTALLLGAAGQPLLAPVAQLLGYTYALLGREAGALHYLAWALAETEGSKRLQPLLTRTQVLIYAGRYEDAGADLCEAGLHLAALPGGAPYHAYLTGLLQRAQGHWEEAQQAFARAAGLARASGETSTEFLAELGVAATLTVQGEWDAARSHLLRAGHLRVNTWEQALLALREGQWRAAQRDQGALATLTLARDTFARLGLPRETAWAELHLAESLADTDDALPAVRRALACQHMLGSGAALLPELRLLPRLLPLLITHQDDLHIATLLRAWAEGTGAAPLQVQVVTLGKPRLLLDGREVRLGMRRTLELLAFLLTRGSATREQILVALWPDDDPRRSSNYFHQAKHELALASPGVHITYDREQGTYSLARTAAALHWDVEFIRRALCSGGDREVERAVLAYTGPFLPEAETEWVREERDALEWAVVNAGLHLMDRWNAAGEYARCAALARRLLRISPADAALAGCLIDATLQLEGAASAWHALREVEMLVTRGLSERPEWLDGLSARLQKHG